MKTIDSCKFLVESPKESFEVIVWQMFPPLTPRQVEVLQSLTRGFSNKDIATQLGMSETRVEQHVNGLLTKIGAANRTEAATIAIRKLLLKI